MKLQERIIEITHELGNPPENTQRQRYLKSYLEELLKYQEANPDELEVPTPLELYCQLNPSALECRIYDD
jgi:hypothetical protein